MARRWEGLPNIEPNEQPSARPLTSTHTMPRLPASQSDPQIDPGLLKVLTDLTDAIRLLILVELASSDNERENRRKIVLAQRVNQRDNKKLVVHLWPWTWLCSRCSTTSFWLWSHCGKEVRDLYLCNRALLEVLH